MITRGAIALVAVVLIVSALAANSKTKEAGASSATEGVTELLNMQADAWNKGDIDKFLTGYVKSDEISYVSSESEVWGYAALRERYVKKYGDSKATMGELSFDGLKVQNLGQDNALCIGHWHLKRDGKEPLNGIFSLVLTRAKGNANANANAKEGWKILHDHTSVTK